MNGTDVVTLKVSRTLRDQLKMQAAARRLTVKGIVEHLITAYLKRVQKEARP